MRSIGRAIFHRMLSVVDQPTRERMGRLLFAAISLWVVSSLALFVVMPPRAGTEFQNLGDYFWGVVIYLFSGLEQYVPQTLAGKIVVGLTLVFAAIFVAIFTAGAVSVLVELTRMRGRIPRKSRSVRMSGHTIICGTGECVHEIVRQLRSDRLTKRKPIVIVSADVEETSTSDLPPHRWWRPLDVWAIGADADVPSLKWANVESASAVVLLAPRGVAHDTPHGAEGRDGSAIRATLLVRSMNPTAAIVVEVTNRSNRIHLWRAGATDLVTPGVIAARMLARAVLAPGSAHVFRDLMSTTSHTSEPYVVPVSEQLVGTSFGDLLMKAVGRGIVPVAIRGTEREPDVNPDRGRILNSGDGLVVVGADERAVRRQLNVIEGLVAAERRS